jgi:hypothetical protein
VRAAVPVPQQAVVANPVQPRRQDGEQEPADEFGRVERHRLGRGGCAIVRVAEAHVAVSDVEEALVGEGDAVHVAADVVEHLSRTGEWRFRVDDPLDLARGLEMIGEALPIGERLERASEPELVGVECLL